MKTQKNKILLTLALSALMALPQGAAAQRIKILGISGAGTSGLMKAELAEMPQGRSIQSVVTRRFQMSTSNDYPKENSYKLYDGRYIVADLDYVEGDDHYYRMEVTLDDGTTLQTDMYNTGYTQGAVWADDIAKEWATAEKPEGDFTWFTTPRPYTGVNHTPITTEDPEGRPLQIHRDRTYNHGLSLRATASGSQCATLNVERRNEHGVPFTSVRFTFGLQAFAVGGGNSTGNGRVIFNLNGAETGWKGNMRAVTNAGNPYYFDATQANNDIRTIGLQSNNGGVDNIAVLGALRLYYAVPQSSREPQTIEFDAPGRTIFADDPEVTINAYATGGTPVFYSIVEGSDIATLDGNVLRPHHGKSGTIVVEALTFGDDNYAPAFATQTYSFHFGPSVEHLYTHPAAGDITTQTVYLYVEPQDKQLEKLSVEFYDNVRSFTHLKTIDLVSEGLAKYAVPGLENVYAVPVNAPGEGTLVHKLTYKFSGEEEVEGKLCEGREPFIYMTDLPGCNPLPNNYYSVGWGNRFYNTSYDNNGPLKTTKYTYAKGYGFHGAGFVETPSTVDLSPFTRFSVDVGGQVITNPTRGRLGFLLYNGVSQAYINTGNVDWGNVYEWDFTLQATAPGKTVKIQVTAGGDGNTNDIVCIGAPRFYYAYETRLPQTLEWIDEVLINNYVPFTMPLTATASSGLPVIYRVIKGGEYARIENGNSLRFYNIPSEGEVVVEAYQPGSKLYDQSETHTCTFRIRKALIIKADERLELEGGNDIDELVVYANAHSAGQAVVKDGIVNVKKLVLKYTFVPGEWNYISFPSDLDLESISDLKAKGFTCAPEEGQAGTYILREYNTRLRAENPGESPWQSVTSGKVTGMKGYIMKLEDAGETPVEITFNIDNVALDFDNTMRAINLSVDMSKCEPETRHTVYVRPSNVKGNTLRIDMRYVPSNQNDIPLNHARALQDMRVTRTQDGGAIRLTLPEQTPARVAIFDRDGRTLLKAVQYVAPMKIDVTDLKPGSYRMVVIYGPASIEKEIEL